MEVDEANQQNQRVRRIQDAIGVIGPSTGLHGLCDAGRCSVEDMKRSYIEMKKSVTNTSGEGRADTWVLIIKTGRPRNHGALKYPRHFVFLLIALRVIIGAVEGI